VLEVLVSSIEGRKGVTGTKPLTVASEWRQWWWFRLCRRTFQMHQHGLPEKVVLMS